MFKAAQLHVFGVDMLIYFTVKLYTKTTLGTHKISSLYTGGLYIQVQ